MTRQRMLPGWLAGWLWAVGSALAIPSLPPPQLPALSSPVLSPGAAVPAWQRDLESALAAASVRYQPVLAIFTAPDCVWCRRLKSTVLTDPAVLELLGSFSLVEIDTARDVVTAAQYQVQGVPALLLLSADGRVRSRVDGYLPPEAMARLLRSMLAPGFATPTESAYAELKSKLQAGPPAAELWPDILREMGDARRRHELRALILKLAPPPRRELVGLLEDPRLAVRLGALDLLEELGAETEGCDPWGEAGTDEQRAAALARLRSWSGETAAAEAAPVWAPLTREQTDRYLRDLVSDAPERQARAARLLEQGGQEAARGAAAYLRDNPDLPEGLRLRVRTVQYALTLSAAGANEPGAAARRLTQGPLDIRLKTLAELPKAGRGVLPVLQDFLDDPEAIVREAAIEALLAVSPARAMPLLQRRLAHEKDADVIHTVLVGIGKSRNRAGLPVIEAFVTHPNEDLVMAALGSLAALKSSMVHEALLAPLNDPRWRVRVAALDAAAALKLGTVEDRVAALLEDPDPFVRSTAVKTLAAISARQADARLWEVFRREDGLKGAVVAAFRTMELPLPEDMPRELAGKEPPVLLAVFAALGKPSVSDLTMLARFAGHPDPDVACSAIRLIGEHGCGLPAYQTLLADVLEHGGRAYRVAALDSLLRSDHLGRIPAALPVRAGTETGTTAEDALFAAFEEAGGAAKTPAPESPVAASAEDVMAAFEAAETPPGTPPGLGTGAGAPASGVTLSVRLRGLASEGAPGDEIRFKAALCLAHMGEPDALEPWIADTSLCTVEQRVEMARILSYGLGGGKRDLLLSLLRDPSAEVRQTLLEDRYNSEDQTAAAAVYEAALAELIRDGAVLEARELPLSAMKSMMARNPRARRKLQRCLPELLAADKAPVKTLALILWEVGGDASTRSRLEPYCAASDPWQRRAAFYALGRSDPERFERDIPRILADTSEFVRAIIPGVLAGTDGRWVDFLSADQSSTSYGGYSGNERTRGALSAPARDALRQLSRDPAPAVALEADLCLLQHREPVDLAALVRRLEAVADPSPAAERIGSFMSANVGALGPSFKVLLPVLERSRADEHEVARLRKHFGVEEGDDGTEVALRVRGAERPVIPAAFVPSGAPAGVSPATVQMVYFMQPGCRECERVNLLLARLRRDYPRVRVETCDLGLNRIRVFNEALADRFRVPDARRLVAPAVFSGAGYLIGEEISLAALCDLQERTARLPDGGALSVPAEALAQAEQSIRIRFSSMSAGVVALAGLLDGVNPCAFATIIFLLSYLQVKGRTPREVAYVGLAFAAAVFLTYFLLGLGLVEVVRQAQGALTWFRKGLDLALAAAALGLALLNIRDGVRCWKGRMGDMTLQLPGFLKSRIHATVRHSAGQARFVVAAFVAGCVISVLELACTGQVYLPTIAFMIDKGGNLPGAVAYLGLYNLLFIAPLLLIVGLGAGGLRSEALTRFLRRHAALVKFLTAALFMVLLAAFLFGDRLTARFMPSPVESQGATRMAPG